jgi:hypothetical protein
MGGVKTRIPPYLETGSSVVINSADAEYVSRADGSD